MSASDSAVQSLNSFIGSFNRRDKDGILSTLHFPLYTHSDGAEPVIIESADDFWRASTHQVAEMRRYEDWGSTTLDYSKVLDATENTVHIQLEITRRNTDGEPYGVARGIWIYAKIEDRWALKIRSMFQKTGEISYLAGQKI
tara:strand:+ start:43 stop:468 length:426 start_codon:yes stop_codon:yes gene_type:complete